MHRLKKYGLAGLCPLARGQALALEGLMLVGLAVAALLVPSTATASVPGGKFNPPKAYYLSLGDSIGFGLQFDKLFALLDAGTYTPDAFNTGYTDDFAAQMRHIRPDQRVENLSCPGETTDTMINGGCFFTSPDGFGLPIHVNYSGAQLDAAVAFLRSHRGTVSPITVSIGGNDAAGVIADQCNFDLSCIAQSGLKQHLSDNLDHILGALRSAAPDTEIIVVAAYNLFKIINPSSDELWNQNYVQVVSDAAAPNNARFANAFDLIHTTDQICQFTFLCTSGDAHPTDAGYQVLANLIRSVSGYDRFTDH
jgi:lysophospholipase L1-like esterase